MLLPLMFVTRRTFFQKWDNDRRAYDVGGEKAQLYRSTKVRHLNAMVRSGNC